MEQIRLGTVGSGAIVRAILDCVLRVPGIALEAVYSRSGERGRALAREYGAEKVYTDLDQLLGDPQVNFVYIATPNALHFEQAQRALLAGKNVICEKPFCVRAEQVDALTALARERNLFLVDATPTAFLPNLEILRRQLPRIGRVRLVQGNYTQYSSRYDRLLAGELTNILDPRYAGGCLMDINFYNAYLNVALFGRPREAVYYPNLWKGRIDTSGVLILRYDGFVSTCAGSKDARGESFFLIEGEQGYIQIPGGSNGIAEVQVVTQDGTERFNGQLDPNRWYYEVRNLTGRVLAGDQGAFCRDLQVTRDVIETLESARKKAGIFFPGDQGA